MRKGRRDPAGVFPDVLEVIQTLKQLRVDKRDAVRAVPDGEDEARSELLASFDERRVTLHAEKTLLLLDHLNDVSLKVSSDIIHNRFRWGLAQGRAARGKLTYRIDATDPHVFFAAKQMEHNIRRSYFGTASSRNRLVTQLVSALGNQMPKLVVKTDISNFFESIPHAGIESMWETSNALSSLSSAFLAQYLAEQAAICGSDIGLPRGVGMSSQLAEAYLQKLDRQIRATPAVSFYARYVDDMVIVLSGSDLESAKRLLSEIASALSSLGLALNESKTSTLPAGDKGAVIGKFEFLGYEFTNPGGKVATTFSRTKVDRYKKRVDDALNAWASHPQQSTGHQGLLLDRWRFMTGNTRLANNKRDAMTGVYFSNPHLTNFGVLTGLDAYARHKIGASSIPEPLRARMLDMSFVSGFEHRTMHRFTQNDLSRITAVWKLV